MGDREPCLITLGMMNCCPATDELTDRPCAYAVCQKHSKAGLWDTVMLALTSELNNLAGTGAFGVFSYFAILLIIVLYVATIQLCLMVVTCHPKFHCVFKCGVENGYDTYINAYGLSISVLIVYGAIFPFLFWREMDERRHLLREVFAGEMYGMKYMVSKPLSKLKNPDTHLTARVARFFGVAPPSKSDGEVRRRQSVAHSASRRSTAHSAEDGDFFPEHDPATGEEVRAATEQDIVDPNEWMRFLSADDSSLARHYDQMTFEGMTYVPAAHFLQVSLVLVPLVTDTNSFAQLFFICLGELFYLMFNLLLLPYASEWARIIALSSSCHHFFIMAVQCLYVAFQHEEDQNEALFSWLMIGFTVAYILVMLWRVIADQATPRLNEMKRIRTIETLFAANGLTMPSVPRMYVLPERVVAAMTKKVAKASEAAFGIVDSNTRRAMRRRPSRLAPFGDTDLSMTMSMLLSMSGNFDASQSPMFKRELELARQTGDVGLAQRVQSALAAVNAITADFDDDGNFDDDDDEGDSDDDMSTATDMRSCVATPIDTALGMRIDMTLHDATASASARDVALSLDVALSIDFALSIDSDDDTAAGGILATDLVEVESVFARGSAAARTGTHRSSPSRRDVLPRRRSVTMAATATPESRERTSLRQAQTTAATGTHRSSPSHRDGSPRRRSVTMATTATTESRERTSLSQAQTNAAPATALPRARSVPRRPVTDPAAADTQWSSNRRQEMAAWMMAAAAVGGNDMDDSH
jgi:hypothetical protein